MPPEPASRLAQLTKLLAMDAADTFTLYALAQEHAKAGNLPLAIDFYNRTLAVDPAYCYAYFHKAKAQAALGEVGAAQATVEAGLSAAQRAGDAKALNELSSLQMELEGAA